MVSPISSRDLATNSVLAIVLVEFPTRAVGTEVSPVTVRDCVVILCSRGGLFLIYALLVVSVTAQSACCSLALLAALVALVAAALLLLAAFVSLVFAAVADVAAAVAEDAEAVALSLLYMAQLFALCVLPYWMYPPHHRERSLPLPTL